MENQDDSQIAKNIYSHSKVYKLLDDNGYYYFGSTCLQLHKRYYQHKKLAQSISTRKLYAIFTYERFLNKEIKIVLIEELHLSNKEELLKEENKHIEKCLNDEKCLNSYHAIANWQKIHENISKYQANYYKEKCDVIKNRVKEYRI